MWKALATLWTSIIKALGLFDKAVDVADKALTIADDVVSTGVAHSGHWRATTVNDLDTTLAALVAKNLAKTEALPPTVSA